MGTFGQIRVQRRLSGWIVVAFLILGVLSAGHHHRLVGSDDTLRFAAPSSAEVIAGADCVFCRAADPVRIVLPDVVVPDVVITSVVTPALTDPIHPQTFPRCSPRAPPVAA
jgi:hypothetical protein